ncbi:DUF2752 domain-containing protein [Williamsia deligens]|uniref:DUF2752 domain-containing protein n=1 Tax=Williamsia deligens TaxID=321325 RepID=A0ABW3G471_9NOCA|nr:DUF2752 domain-containing protein [Williamsia deligens]MCP2194886.1 Protein of unknown function (DUF2752) [Williamsia deligens]
MTTAETRSAPRGSVRTTALAAAVGAGAVVAAAVIPTSVVGNGPVLCPFRLVTGLPCPGCGLTRSWVAVAHGDVASAFSDNAFGPISFTAVVAMTVAAAVLALVAPARIGVLAAVARSRVVYSVAAVWVVYGIVRAVDAAAGIGWFPAVT